MPMELADLLSREQARPMCTQIASKWLPSNGFQLVIWGCTRS